MGLELSAYFNRSFVKHENDREPGLLAGSPGPLRSSSRRRQGETDAPGPPLLPQGFHEQRGAERKTTIDVLRYNQ